MRRLVLAAAVAVAMSADAAGQGGDRPVRMIFPPAEPTAELLAALPPDQARAVREMFAVCAEYNEAETQTAQRAIESGAAARLAELGSIGRGRPWVGRLDRARRDGDYLQLRVLVASDIALITTGAPLLGGDGRPGAGPMVMDATFAYFARQRPGEIVPFRANVVRAIFVGGRCEFTADFRTPDGRR